MALCGHALNSSGRSPVFPDRDTRVHSEPVHKAPVLVRRHAEDVFLRHRPVEPPPVLIDAVVNKRKTVPFKSECFQACAPLSTEQEEGVFVIRVKMELVLYDRSQLVYALAHIGIIRKDPYVRVFVEIKVPKHGRPPPAHAAGTHWKNDPPQLSGTPRI